MAVAHSFRPLVQEYGFDDASETTRWFMLVLKFGESELTECFRCGRHCCNYWHGDLKYTSPGRLGTRSLSWLPLDWALELTWCSRRKMAVEQSLRPIVVVYGFEDASWAPTRRLAARTTVQHAGMTPSKLSSRTPAFPSSRMMTI